jgi:hypothetical protein
MHIHLPHIKPAQRAMLRNLLGALLAILAAIILIVLMAILLVFPDSIWSSQVDTGNRPVYANEREKTPTDRVLDAKNRGGIVADIVSSMVTGIATGRKVAESSSLNPYPTQQTRQARDYALERHHFLDSHRTIHRDPPAPGLLS